MPKGHGRLWSERVKHTNNELGVNAYIINYTLRIVQKRVSITFLEEVRYIVVMQAAV